MTLKILPVPSLSSTASLWSVSPGAQRKLAYDWSFTPGIDMNPGSLVMVPGSKNACILPGLANDFGKKSGRIVWLINFLRGSTHSDTWSENIEASWAFWYHTVRDMKFIVEKHGCQLSPNVTLGARPRWSWNGAYLLVESPWSSPIASPRLWNRNRRISWSSKTAVVWPSVLYRRI